MAHDDPSKVPMTMEALLEAIRALSLRPEALAAAFTAAQERSEARRALVSPLDEEIRKNNAMRRPVPGGRLGYSRNVTSWLTGATFTAEVQESRQSPLGRVTGLLDYRVPENWREILTKSIPMFADPLITDDNKRLQQAKFERWYRRDLRHYVGALVGAENSGEPTELCMGEHWFVKLPVEWPDEIKQAAAAAGE